MTPAHGEDRLRRPLRLLGLSGSLRAASTNTALLRAAMIAAPRGVVLTLFGGIGALPIFNPDLEEESVSQAVLDLRRAVAAADGLVFAVPEYAHGIPGGLKNALDWLVSGGEIPGKPVALFHASPRSAISRAALEEVLRTMSTTIVPEASAMIPLLGLPGDAVAETLASDAATEILHAALLVFSASIRSLRQVYQS